MEITLYNKYNQTGFSIVGKLCSLQDYQNLHNYYHALGTSNKNLIIDLSRLTFSSSHGLSLLVEMAKTLNSQGKKLFLMNPREEIRSIIELIGVDRLVSILNTEENSLAEILQALRK